MLRHEGYGLKPMDNVGGCYILQLTISKDKALVGKVANYIVKGNSKQQFWTGKGSCQGAATTPTASTYLPNYEESSPGKAKGTRHISATTQPFMGNGSYMVCTSVWSTKGAKARLPLQPIDPISGGVWSGVPLTAGWKSWPRPMSSDDESHRLQKCCQDHWLLVAGWDFVVEL